ncbi:unnamed protein product [Prunus armeniaca]
MPQGQDNQVGQPLPTNKEVNHRRPNHGGYPRDAKAMLTDDVEKLVNNRVAPPKRFSMPSLTHFKVDSIPESHLKYFKSVMILYKADDALMCKVFVMTLQREAQDWFHTLPSGSISSFKDIACIFTQEYTSYRTIKKNHDHLFNMHKKSDESL